MSEFKKRSAANTPVPETTAPDAFADNDWNEEDFEQKINMSLNKKLKNTTDPQWNEMLETFNSESTDKDADFADIPQNVNASDDDYTVQPVAKTDAFSDGTDDNIFSDDFDDPPEKKPSEDESNGDFSDDFDDNFDDNSKDEDLSDDFDDDFGDDFSDEKAPVSFGSQEARDNVSPRKAEDEDASPSFNLVLRLLILLAAVLTGLAVLINMSIKNAAKDSDSWPTESTGSQNAPAAPVSSDTSAEVSSEVAASSEDKASSQDQTSSEETTPKHNYKELKKGDKSENVLKMQNRLCELGFLTESSCTGYYGDFTVKKVKLFQKAAGLEQTGTADPMTLERLYAKDAPKA